MVLPTVVRASRITCFETRSVATKPPCRSRSRHRDVLEQALEFTGHLEASLERPSNYVTDRAGPRGHVPKAPGRDRSATLRLHLAGQVSSSPDLSSARAALAGASLASNPMIGPEETGPRSVVAARARQSNMSASASVKTMTSRPRLGSEARCNASKSRCCIAISSMNTDGLARMS